MELIKKADPLSGIWPVNIAVMIYDQVEHIDMCGPIDTFISANMFNKSLNQINNPSADRYNIYTVAEKHGPVNSDNNILTIIPRYSIEDKDLPTPNIIVIPATTDFDEHYLPNQIKENSPVIKWIKDMAGNENTKVMSVCTGAFILALTGLFDNKNATTHYTTINDFHCNFLSRNINVIKNERYVTDEEGGNIISTGGVTSGIDGALYLVHLIDGELVARQTADMLVYNRAAQLPPYTLLPPYLPYNCPKS
jgi:transcriptional regulator GlxA family with amidase domain